MLKAFMRFGFISCFTRANIMEVAGITATPATELMRKMKDANLIKSVKGRGRYMFVEPKDKGQRSMTFVYSIDLIPLFFCKRIERKTF